MNESNWKFDLIQLSFFIKTYQTFIESYCDRLFDWRTAMYLHKMQFIVVVFSVLLFESKALPNTKFIYEFALQHQKSNIILHASEEAPIQDGIHW